MFFLDSSVFAIFNCGKYFYQNNICFSNVELILSLTLSLVSQYLWLTVSVIYWSAYIGFFSNPLVTTALYV
jgi:hypothetical protein